MALDLAVFDSFAIVFDVAGGFEGPAPVLAGVGESELQAVLIAFVGKPEKCPLIPPHDENVIHSLDLRFRLKKFKLSG